MTKLEYSEQYIFEQANEKYDFDKYFFVGRSQIATKETTIIVNFKQNKIYGDRIAFGEWYDIETEECIELLKTLETHEIIRDFNDLINQYEKLEK